MKLEQAARQLLDCFENGLIDLNAVTALRDALNHSADADKMIGCAYCNNPLFAGTKCNNCGRVTLAEQAEQEPVAWLWVNEQGSERLEWEPVQDISKWKSTPLYAAPVRTKDLTDDEIYSVVANLGFAQLSPIEVARAVIGADREKNRGTA